MRSRALTALTMVLPVEYPAELAADCMQLFSRMERLEWRRPMRRRKDPSEKERMQAVIAMPSPQPVLSPIKRFERLIIAPSMLPIRTARVVNWGRSPR